METTILLSIILPVYNAELTLETCLHSLEEDLSTGNIELIAVDDGSTDSSYKYIEHFKSRYPEYITLIKQSNGGQGKARNHAIAKAKGMYLGFVDADDAIKSGMFTLMLDTITEQNTDMVICDFTKVFEQGQQETIYFKQVNTHPISPKVHKELLFSCGNSSWNKVFKKDLLLKHKLYFQEGMIYEDLAMIPLLISKCHTISRIPQALYFYAVHADSTTHNSHKKIDDHLKALTILQQKCSSEYNDEILFLALKELFFYTLPRYVTILDKATFHSLFKTSLEYFLTSYPNWKQNPYINALPLMQHIYVSLVLSKNIWVIRIASKYKTF